MSSLYRILIINTIFILIMQVNGGYWMCDWVSDRGWMYCSHGQCTVVEKKRNIEIDHEHKGPMQNSNGVYCLTKQICYKCEPINKYTCRLALQKDYVPTIETYSHNKRADNDLCW